MKKFMKFFDMDRIFRKFCQFFCSGRSTHLPFQKEVSLNGQRIVMNHIAKSNLFCNKSSPFSLDLSKQFKLTVDDSDVGVRTVVLIVITV